MGQITVGISEMVLSGAADDVLVTYSLGSCLGLTLYDPIARVGGMIHCMMPLAKMDPAKAEKTPAMFVDSGVTAFLQALFEMGAKKNNIVAKAAGCANVLQQTDHFKLGERNFTVLRKIFWRNGILIAAQDVGGAKPRTMYLNMADGRTVIKSRGEESEL